MSSAAYVVGVAGGSGSGKTTVAKALYEALPKDRVAMIQHDSYYRHRPELSDAERAAINFDHPTALDTELLVHHVDELRRGLPIDVPIYDFAAHLRLERTQRTLSKSVIIVEGILVLSDAALRSRLDLKLYVDTDADVRILRRAQRDISERGRTFEQVTDQYYRTVRPMHLEYVEPSKRFADLVIVDGGATQVAIDTLVARLERVLQR